jgi:Rod binding domain-containing protein
MSDPRIGFGPRSAATLLPSGSGDRDRLRILARELEGVFLNQLFQAMRQSLQTTSGETASPGEEMFTSLFDQSMADQAAGRMEHGLADVLYRQLAARLDASREGQ